MMCRSMRIRSMVTGLSLLGLTATAGCSDDDTTDTAGGGSLPTTSGTGGGSTTTTDTASGGSTSTSTTSTTDTGTTSTTVTGDDIDPCSGNTYTPTMPLANQGAEPAGSTADQHTARLDVDAIRNELGLNAIDFVAAINQAAQAHSDYCSTNASWCPGWHSEEPGHPGFTGANFWERMQAAGYTGSAAMEVMAPGIGPSASVRMWMETVYHRTPFVSPEIDETGYGGGANYTTMDFGCCGPFDAALVTNYPVHGKTGVPASWGGNEGPTPPAPQGGYPSGPVISVIFPPSAAVTISAVELFDDTCTAVPHLVGGTSLPDVGLQLNLLPDRGVVLYANDPLQQGADYTVNVEYTADGTAGHRTFQFTTQ